MHTTLTMLSFTVGNISSVLCSSIFGIFFVGGCRTLCKFNTSPSHIMVRDLRKKTSYKNANILSQLWKVYPKRNTNESCIQTYIYEQMYLHIFLKSTGTFHSASEYKYCTLSNFDLHKQFHTALIRKVWLTSKRHGKYSTLQSVKIIMEGFECVKVPLQLAPTPRQQNTSIIDYIFHAVCVQWERKIVRMCSNAYHHLRTAAVIMSE